MIRIQVPATTANLGPGLDTLGMALQLYNTVEMEETPRGLLIEAEGEGAGKIPKNEDNIIYRAAQKVFAVTGYQPAGLRIKLVNNIPVARGLGSSAAAIVGGLMGANFLAGGKLAERDLVNLASSLEGHPDNVAPAILGGIVVSSLVDGEVKFFKIQPPRDLRCVVAVPDFPLSTKRARDVLPQQVSLADAVFNISRASLIVAGLMQGDLNILASAMEDRLHQPYRSSLVPGMKKVFAAAKLAGAKGVALSGAGPTLIAFGDENLELIAQVMKETFLANGVRAKVWVLEPNPVGARVLVIHKNQT